MGFYKPGGVDANGKRIKPKTPTLAQRERIETLRDDLIPKQREEAQRAQAQRARLIYDASLLALHQNYLVAEKAFNDKILQLTKYFDNV